jgi:hypothetical protein
MLAMKKLILPVFILLLAWSCSPSQKTGTTAKSNVVVIDSSTEYDITIIDTEFDTWYLMNYSPAKDYGNEYYRNWNQIGVGNWNDYFMEGKYSRIIENHIFYQYSIDYGIEVNRKLYWYFKFIEDNFKIRLLK